MSLLAIKQLTKAANKRLIPWSIKKEAVLYETLPMAMVDVLVEERIIELDENVMVMTLNFIQFHRLLLACRVTLNENIARELGIT